MVFCNSSLRLSVIGILFATYSIQCHEQNNEHQHRQTVRDLSDGGADFTKIVRCGTEETTPEIGAETAKMVKSWEAKKISDGWKGGKLSNDVNVYFHIINDSSGNGMTETNITDSLVVMNESFRDFNFIQAGVTVTTNDAWFKAGPGSSAAIDMFQNLRRGGRKDLNVYFYQPGGGFLGFASLPWSYEYFPIDDGVVIDYKTIPGGTFIPYNKGYTLVHEVGHWLGLSHTFTGGCYGEGDYVDDTPKQGEPTRGCPTSKDSCDMHPGNDPIHNFMDYSDDSCQYEFSPGQNVRMAAMWECYRQQTPGTCGSDTQHPGLLETGFNGLCFSSSSTVIVKGKGETSLGNIHVGYEVLTALGDYEIVYSIDHRSTTKISNFIQIYYSLPMMKNNDHHNKKRNRNNNNEEEERQHYEKKPLEITSMHMIYLVGNDHPVPANNVKIGDQIQTLSGPGTVTNISTIAKEGFYNVLTGSGSIVVNGIFASTYSARFSNNEWIGIHDNTATTAGGGGGGGGSSGLYNKRKRISHQDFFRLLLKPFQYLCTATVSLEMMCEPTNEGDERSLIGKFQSSVHKFVSKQNKLYHIVSLCFLVLYVQVVSHMCSPLDHIIGILGILLVASFVVQQKEKKKKNDNKQTTKRSIHMLN